MFRVVATVLLVVFSILIVPASVASESVSRDYITGGFRVLGIGPGFTIFSNGYDADDDGQEDVPPIGGGRLQPSTAYSNVIISATDDVYGSETALSACLWEPGNDDVVQEPYCIPAGCGVGSLLGSPYASDELTVFIYTVVVTDDLDVCGASTGTMTGDFF